MNSLEWFKSNTRRALVPDMYGPAEFACFHPATEQLPDDVPPQPDSQPHALLMVRRGNRVAHHWISEVMMDDVSVDIWADIWPLIQRQLGMSNA